MEKEKTDMSDKDVKDYNNLKNKVKDIMAEKVPEFEFDEKVQRTIQGTQYGCLYPVDDPFDTSV